MTLHAFTDGASRGNPGESGIGILVTDTRGRVLLTLQRYLGRSTNNRAEYEALITLLEHVRALSCERLIVHSDSELMVRQVAGRYRVKDASLRKLHHQVTSLIGALPFPVELRHVTREQNRDADRLANVAIDTKRSVQEVTPDALARSALG